MRNGGKCTADARGSPAAFSTRGDASRPDAIALAFSRFPQERTGAVKDVLFYDAAADLDRARAVFPAHRAKWQEFGARGELLLIGPFSDPRQGGDGRVRHARGRRGIRARRPVRAGGCRVW